LVQILDLGRQPLANALLPSRDHIAEEKRYPLTLMFCEDCSLVQIRETVEPEVLFSDYVYFSSFSDTMLEHARQLVNEIIEVERLGESSLVIEIASNDGYLLRNYCRASVPVLGIEPAANVAEVAMKEHGIPIRVEFFGEEMATDLAKEGLLADVVHAHNVYAHVPDPNGFTAGLKQVLKPGGVAVIEAPYVRDMADRLEFDTIYHEHFSYYSLTAVDALVRRHGLEVSDVRHLPLHGGTLRYYVRHEGAGVSDAVSSLLATERDVGLTDRKYYLEFSNRIWKLGGTLKTVLDDLLEANRRIAAYGASAKGSTLLNTYEIGSHRIEFIADRSSVKQGLLSPGTHLEIVSPAALLERRTDYVLLLTWNFAAEILSQQAEFRRSGGLFIVPVPEVRIL
jgi:SAM-dependent methyltransferase